MVFVIIPNLAYVFLTFYYYNYIMIPDEGNRSMNPRMEEIEPNVRNLSWVGLIYFTIIMCI